MFDDSKPPTHRAYHVPHDEPGEYQFPRREGEIGEAWLRQDGDSFDVQLYAMPTGEFSGHIVLRPVQPKA